MNSQTRLFELFRANFMLCEVKQSETVAVLSEGDILSDYLEASLEALRSLGIQAKDVNVPSVDAKDASYRIANIGQNALSNNPDALKICKEADMVIDHMLLLFSQEQIDMQAAGTRVLLIVEPLEILERLFPTVSLRRRVEAAENRFRQASLLRFTNSEGTDILYNLDSEKNPILTEYGFTTQPSRWDHWPGGFIASLASENSVNGRVVMGAKDIIFPLKSYVEDNIEFIIRDGWVKEINGGKKAQELQQFIDSYDDPRAYAVSHIGWGLNDLCLWDPTLPGIGMDGRAHYGNVLFSLGPDTEFGGKNDTSCHLDLPMQGCNLWLDDELIVENGEIVPREMCL